MINKPSTWPNHYFYMQQTRTCAKRRKEGRRGHTQERKEGGEEVVEEGRKKRGKGRPGQWRRSCKADEKGAAKQKGADRVVKPTKMSVRRSNAMGCHSPHTWPHTCIVHCALAPRTLPRWGKKKEKYEGGEGKERDRVKGTQDGF